MNKILFLLTASFLVLPTYSNAQTAAEGSIRGVGYQALPTPLAPNAASLGKFGAIPVNIYTGLPTIQLPLYTIKQGTLSIPITLAYHSAIKVDEVPSWVGLGWALQAGGAITQTVRGGGDQGNSQGYWLNKAYVDSLNPRFMSQPLSTIPERIASGAIDLQPDIYFYNLPFGSGQILFTDSTHAIAVSERGVDIRFTHHRFEVTDRTGTRYILGDAAACRDYSYVEGNDAAGNVRGGSGAYYISKIISANQQDTIRFSYNKEELTQELAPTETDYLYEQSTYAPSGIQAPPKQITQSTQYSSQCQLREIVWRQGRVKFIANIIRDDLGQIDGTAAHGLSEISILNKKNSILKSYSFVYDYFYTNDELEQIGKIPGHSYNPTELRLKLTTVTEQHHSLTLPSHRFKYFEHQGIPARNSYKQDHWGFANQNKVSTFLPKYLLINGGTGVKIYDDGGSREPDFSSALAGVLREITYPTGGKTQFKYEPHRVSHTGNAVAVKLQSTTKSLRLVAHDFIGVPDNDDVVKSTTFTLTQPTAATHSYGLSAQGYATAFAIVRYTLTKVFPDNPTLNTIIASDQAVDDGTIKSGGQSGPVTVSSGGPRGLNLLPGTYELRLTGSRESAKVRAGGSVDLIFTQAVADTARISQGVLVGGTRIKRIVDIAGNLADSTAKNYSYSSLKNGVTVSSGALVKNPIYTSPFTDYFQIPLSSNYSAVKDIIPFTYLCISASSLGGVGMTKGSHVGYGRVQVSSTNGGLDNGYELHFFTTAARYPDIGSLSPYVPPTSQDYLRGTLLRQESYSAGGQLLKRIQFAYKVDTRVTSQLSGLVARRIAADYPGGMVSTNSPVSRYRFDYFRDKIQWKYEYQRISTTFAPTDTTQQNIQKQTSVYGNPVHGQLTQLRTQLNNGQVRVQYNRYPPDYPIAGTDNVSLGLHQLQTAHIWNPVIETSVWDKPADKDDSLLLTSQVRTYRPRAAKATSLLDRVYTLNLTQPVMGYQLPTTSTAGWLMDSRYEEQEQYAQYNAQDNPVLLTRAHRSSPHAYLWGYGGELLIGEAANCVPSQLASTSFEPEATGRWAYDSTGTHRVLGGRTGHYAYQLDGTVGITRAQLPAGDYELCYWLQGRANLSQVDIDGGYKLGGNAQLLTSAPSDWNQYRLRLRLTRMGKVSLNGPLGLLDEVRLYPVGAQLTSFTHQPLIGITSQTTADGRTIFYEYDKFQRLVCTRDEQGRILTQQQYHYAGQ